MVHSNLVLFFLYTKKIYYYNRNNLTLRFLDYFGGPQKKIFLGNVAYFNNSDYYNIKRFYSSADFKSWKMKFGLMPPHPASFIKKEIAECWKTYKQVGMKKKGNKMVPNCIPKGKLKKKKGDPCWKNYVQRGMKNK
jgi:hypothetical protein